MRICFVAPNVYPVLAGRRNVAIVGGAEVQQALLAKLLAQRGHQVTLLSFDFGQGAECTESGVRIVTLKTGGPRIVLLRYVYPRLTSIWSAMHAVGADVYYQRCAGAYTGLVAAFCRYARRKFVYACASDQDLAAGRRNIVAGWRDRQLYFFGLRRADCVVVQSAEQEKRVRDWQVRRTVRIPSCHEYPAQRQGEPAPPFVLWVGVLRRQKRPELFVELARRLPRFRFCMVGGPCASGQDQAFFERIRSEARTLANLDFVGFVPYVEVGRYFDQAAVLANTSDFEGFPNTFLQAWARGVPTVSFFDCGAHDECGAVSAPVPDLAGMARRIALLMSDRGTHSAAGWRCRRYFEKYHSPQAAVAAYEILFASLASAST